MKVAVVTIVFFITLANLFGQANFIEISASRELFSIKGGRGVSIGDYDNDADDDIFIAAQPSKLFRNDGNFNFTDVTPSSGLGSNAQLAVWFDADDDGWLDIYIANWLSTTFFRNNGNGTFTEVPSSGLSQSYAPQALLVGDLNGDQFLDVYCNNFNHENQLFVNKGSNHFSDRSANTGATVASQAMGGVLTDFDKDGDLDIYLAFDGNNPNKLYQNDGTGKFEQIAEKLGVAYKGQGMGVDVADFNHDGLVDFYITNLYDNALLMSKPDSTYVDRAKELGVNDFGMGWGVVCFDYNNDAFSDIYVNNEYGFSPYTNKLYQNNYGINFYETGANSVLENRAGGYGLAVSDLDSDGRQDIVLVNQNAGGVKIFKNNESSVGHWLEINLAGITSNKFGIGARVEVTTSGISQFKEVTAGSGYMSQNSATVHFGIGSATKIDSLKIYWPDGTMNDYFNVDFNQRYLAIQGNSLNVFSVTHYLQALTQPSQLPIPVIEPDPEIPITEGHSMAHLWNEAQLSVIRKDFARPTVQARNLFHVSMAMYDAWAAFDDVAKPFLLGNTVGDFFCAFNGIQTTMPKAEARSQAISYAAFRMLEARYKNSPGAAVTLPPVYKLFSVLGYDASFVSTDYSNGSPAALGNYIAAKVIEFGLGDGSNEANNFANQYYQPINTPLLPAEPGPRTVTDPNRWQPITLTQAIDQNGNTVSNTSPFLTPEWGNVVPFALKENNLETFTRNGNAYKVYHDPGPPPLLDKENGGGTSSEYKWNFELVSAWSSHLSPADSVAIDISPNSIGNIQSYPTSLSQYHSFYDFENGGDASVGYSVNPKTSAPYKPQVVYRGDYTRVLAEFWADGPNSETPPGHWFTLLNYVIDHPSFVPKFRGSGDPIDQMEWDVKSYFILGGAMHDVAITAWGIKGYYDYVRPITAIRYLANLGQSSDMNKPRYHPAGIELKPGLIELVEAMDPLAGPNGEHINKIKIKAWNGPTGISNPAEDEAGVGWILAENWYPYQRPTFVTPPFAGYISGHSTYSSAAAEVLTLLTGDEYFPGGLGEFEAFKNQYLVFEDGPAKSITLQWARYKDASDQCSLSRIWGGIHPPADDIPGRHIGKEIGKDAFQFALGYFNGTVTAIPGEEVFTVDVFPIPANRNETLRINVSDVQTEFNLSLIDLLGRPVVNQSINNAFELNLAGLQSGMYVVIVRSNKSLYKQKIIIR